MARRWPASHSVFRALLTVTLLGAACGSEESPREARIALEEGDQSCTASEMVQIEAVRLSAGATGTESSTCYSILEVETVAELEEELRRLGIALDGLTEGSQTLLLYGYDEPGCPADQIELCGRTTLELGPAVEGQDIVLSIRCEGSDPSPEYTRCVSG